MVILKTTAILAHQRGVNVEIVLDKSNAEARYPEGLSLANQGIPVRLDYRYAIMHDKVLVIAGQTVETGSFNFTSAASQSEDCSRPMRRRRFVGGEAPACSSSAPSSRFRTAHHY